MLWEWHETMVQSLLCGAFSMGNMICKMQIETPAAFNLKLPKEWTGILYVKECWKWSTSQDSFPTARYQAFLLHCHWSVWTFAQGSASPWPSTDTGLVSTACLSGLTLPIVLSWPLFAGPALSTPSPPDQVLLRRRSGLHGSTPQLHHRRYLGYSGAIAMRNAII